MRPAGVFPSIQLSNFRYYYSRQEGRIGAADEMWNGVKPVKSKKIFNTVNHLGIPVCSSLWQAGLGYALNNRDFFRIMELS